MPGCLACSIALISSKSFFSGRKSHVFLLLDLMHCFCMKESKKWKRLTISLSIQKILLRPLRQLVGNIAEINILFGYIFDINTKIQLDN